MDGFVLAQFEVHQYEIANAVLELPDKTVLVASDVGLKRYSENGRFVGELLDRFRSTSQLIYLGDDKVLVGCERFSSDHGPLLLINSAGVIDPSVSADASVYVMLKQPDGKILIGGNFTVVNGKARPYLARLMPDCSLDDTFRPPGILGENPRITHLALQSDGSIIAAGLFSYVGETKRTMLARFSSDGQLDLSYDPGSLLTSSRPSDNQYIGWMANYENNTYIQGYFGPAGDILYNVTRIDPTGMEFSGMITNQGIRHVAMQPDGNFLVAGGFGYVNSRSIAGRGVYETLMRLSRDGKYDSTFLYADRWDLPMPSKILFSNKGSLFVAGHSSSAFLYKLATDLPDLRITSPSYMSNHFSFTIESSLAEVVQIEGTTDFIHWTPLLQKEISPPRSQVELPLSATARYFRVRTD